MFRVATHCLILSFGLFSVSAARADAIAVLGDSFSTGAVAHPALRFESDALEKIFAGEQPLVPDSSYYEKLLAWEPVENPPQIPQRLRLSRREYQNPLSWVFQSAFSSVTQNFIDSEEYSWFYLLARKRKVSPHEVFIAAQDGESSDDAVRQVDRVFDATGNHAVRHLFVFFSGTDLCSPDAQYSVSSEVYAENIEKALRYYLAQAKTDMNTSHIWLVDPLGILQFASSPDILKKKVPSFGKEVSCRDLQSGISPRNLGPIDPKTAGPLTVLTQFFGLGPRAYCPALFALHEDTNSSERLIQLGSILTGYRQQLQKLAKKLEGIDQRFRVHHLQAAGSLLFEGKDMAQDCFHLSLDGQLKIASALDEEVTKLLP